MRERQLFSHDPLEKPFKMATEHVERDKQTEQTGDSSPSGWNVTTSRMVIGLRAFVGVDCISGATLTIALKKTPGSDH